MRAKEVNETTQIEMLVRTSRLSDIACNVEAVEEPHCSLFFHTHGRAVRRRCVETG